MLTPGRCCSPCCWILLAMTLSATAFAAKSSTTSSTMITTRVMIQPRPRRRRDLGLRITRVGVPVIADPSSA